MKSSRGAAVAWGSICALIWAYILAPVHGCLIGFPVPFAGYLRGPEHFLSFIIAVTFYIVIGGIVLLIVAGAIAGLMAHSMDNGDGRRILFRTPALVPFVLIGLYYLFLLALPTLGRFSGFFR